MAAICKSDRPSLLIHRLVVWPSCGVELERGSQQTVHSVKYFNIIITFAAYTDSRCAVLELFGGVQWVTHLYSDYGVVVFPSFHLINSLFCRPRQLSRAKQQRRLLQKLPQRTIEGMMWQ